MLKRQPHLAASVALQQAARPSLAPSRPVAAAVGTVAPASPPDAVIEVRDLRKTYPDGTVAVGGVTFQVRRGEIFGFLGPNGAGKTTTMRILGTLLRASSGSARVLGHDVVRQSRQVRRRIGFAMQEVGLDDLATAREILVLHSRLYGMSRRDAKARAEELLRTFNLVEHADRRVTRFSGGMQRRLDLAVSLVHTPEVLFLDEPSTGLDPTSRADLWQVLRRLRTERGVTIMLSTHYMEEADALCDRIAIMNAGRVAAIGTPQDLKRSVGADRLRVELGGPLASHQLASLRTSFGAANVQSSDGALDIRVRDGARALLPALRIVGDLGVEVRGTRVLSPTLEDVFLHYTGSRFSEAAKPEPAAAGAARSGPHAADGRGRGGA